MQAAVKERISQKYEFIRDLGSDWVGEIYEAKRHLGGGRVVIKTLHQRTAENHQLANKIYKSIKKVRPIIHPNIAKIIEVEKTDDNQIFFVREFFKGETLRSLINRKGKLPIEQAVNISIQILSALSAIHKRGFIHGSLNPSNIYLYEEKDEIIFIKLIDYSMFDVQDIILEFDDMIKNYMSPEQAIGDSAGDEQTDVFAVGAILYELLSGQRAYETKDDEDVTLQIAMHSPVPLRSIAKDIPPKLLIEIDKAMDSEREKRHRNVVEFIKMLLPFSPNIANNSSPSSLSALKRLLPGERTLVGDNSANSKEKIPVRENTELYNSKEKIEIRPSIAPVKPSSQTKLHFQKSKQKGQKLTSKQITSESIKETVLETKLITITATEPSVFSEKALESLNPPFAKIEKSKNEQISKSLETEEESFPQKENINLENISEEESRTSSDNLTQIEEEIDSNIFLEETEEDSNILPLSYLEKDKTESIHPDYKKNKIVIRINKYTSLWGTKAKHYFEIVSSSLLKKANNLKPFLVGNREKVITFAKEKKPTLVQLAKSSVATKRRQYITATSLVLLAMLIVVLIVAGSNGEDSKAMADEKSSQALIEKNREKTTRRKTKEEESLRRLEEKAGLENNQEEKSSVNEIEENIVNEETGELEEIKITNTKKKPLPKKRHFFQKHKRKFKKVSKSPVNKNWATNPFERH